VRPSDKKDTRPNHKDSNPIRAFKKLKHTQYRAPLRALSAHGYILGLIVQNT
jgi:hypothetical protein